jgi:hypothetical protein
MRGRFAHGARQALLEEVITIPKGCPEAGILLQKPKVARG